jgi:hypothetical protein
MAATTGNTSPLWVGTVRSDRVVIGQAAVSVNSQAPGTIGTNCFLLSSVTGADGSYIQKIRFAYSSTTGAVNIAATNLNIFISTINSGATSTANTFLYTTVQVPAQTIGGVTVAPIFYEAPLNLGLPQNTYILVAQTVAATANGAWVAHCVCGGY